MHVQGLSKSYGERLLFSDVSFNLTPGERVGLVGRNGQGKSTLVRIIAGKEQADSGEITLPKGHRIGHLDQHMSFTNPTILEECRSALPDDQKFDDYRIERIASGLGIPDVQIDPRDLSGGQQIRINLAKLLLQESDLLLLDEPSNYLDIVGIRWLKRFLAQYPGQLILITHDRGLMDSVVNSVMGIHHRKLRKVKGGTQSYLRQIDEERELHEKTRANQQKQVKEMQNFVDRFRAKARLASQAQSRLKQLDKMDILDEWESQQELSFSFQQLEFAAKTLLETKDVAHGYGQAPDLFKTEKLFLNKGQRIGIIGANGKGKTTLLNVLAGKLSPRNGEVKYHPKVEIAYYGQTNVAHLHDQHSIEQELMGVGAHISPQRARDIAGQMMFPGDDALKLIKVLSGGEKARVMLGKVLATQCNLLILDEPTNHLDQESIQAMIRGINSFEGGVLVVGHDEDFLRATCTHIWAFTNDGLEVYPGGYDYFLEKRGWDDGPVQEKTERSKFTKKERQQKRQEIIAKKNTQLRPLKKTFQSLSDELGEIEQSIEQNQNALLQAVVKGEGKDIERLTIEARQLETKMEELLEELAELEEQITSKEDHFRKQLEELE